MMKLRCSYYHVLCCLVEAYYSRTTYCLVAVASNVVVIYREIIFVESGSKNYVTKLRYSIFSYRSSKSLIIGNFYILLIISSPFLSFYVSIGGEYFPIGPTVLV